MCLTILADVMLVVVHAAQLRTHIFGALVNLRTTDSVSAAQA